MKVILVRIVVIQNTARIVVNGEERKFSQFNAGYSDVVVTTYSEILLKSSSTNKLLSTSGLNHQFMEKSAAHKMQIRERFLNQYREQWYTPDFKRIKIIRKPKIKIAEIQE